MMTIARLPADPMRDVMRFIILSCERCGTGMMRRTLNAHPNVACRAEALDAVPDFRELVQEWGVTTEALLALRARDTTAFLEQYVLSSRNAAHQAAGCKLFYYHADVADRAEPWRWLNSQPRLRVIHLQRRNQLRRFLSHQTARATGEWMRRQNTRVPAIPAIEIAAKDFLADVSALKKLRDRAVARLGRLEMIDMYYEDLVADFAGQMARVQSFLGVQPMPLVSDTLRQNTRPLAERIRNFAALRSALADTPHAWMLDD